MKNLIYFHVLLITMASFAQERGFHSKNDMSPEEPRFSFGSTKHRTASISLGDINNDGKLMQL